MGLGGNTPASLSHARWFQECSMLFLRGSPVGVSSTCPKSNTTFISCFPSPSLTSLLASLHFCNHFQNEPLAPKSLYRAVCLKKMFVLPVVCSSLLLGQHHWFVLLSLHSLMSQSAPTFFSPKFVLVCVTYAGSDCSREITVIHAPPFVWEWVSEWERKRSKNIIVTWSLNQPWRSHNVTSFSL